MSYNIEDKSNEYHGGVPHFMPPERVYDHNIKFSVKKGDVKSEIFQLGIIMYQIIYGKNPFTGILWKDLAKSIKNDKPIFDDKTLNGEEIPADLILIISKSLEKKPDNRFESTTTALQELNKINIYYNEETDINN
jgi:serine/threonine protein kinase